MRRLFACTVGLLLLVSCTDGTDPSTLDDQQGEEEGLSPTANFEIFDGTSESDGANPHFFFLPPIAPTTPAFAGVPDLDENPHVTVCRSASWNLDGKETCGSVLVEFSTTVDDGFGNTVTIGPGGKYRVRWDTDEWEINNGEEFVVAVSLGRKAIGWVDVRAYRNNRYPHLDPDGNVALTVGGELNIVFRVEEGALESEYCDTSSLEDCDVEVFQYDEEGCLRVFENPGQAGELLGSRACVPASAARLENENGVPVQVEGEYAVILTLEDTEEQGGMVPSNYQLPFFPDLKTDPPGITFDPLSDGVAVVICQAAEGPGSIDEDLHPQLRPFIVYSNGTTSLPGPEDYDYGSPECEGYGSHAHSTALAPESKGIWGRFAAGLTKASTFFLPKPLRARRLHGGLNTTVYNTSGDDGGDEEEPGGDNGPEQVDGLQPAGETFVVELGAILDVDLNASTASFASTWWEGIETEITITALNALLEPFPVRVPVIVTVEGDGWSEMIEADPEGIGTYSVIYKPTVVGETLEVTVTIDGRPITGPPFPVYIDVVPTGELNVDVTIAGGAPEDGLPVILYGTNSVDELFEAGRATTGENGIAGIATFPAVPFGSYTVHLPQRDFDVQFTSGMTTEPTDFNSDGQTLAYFIGETQSLPDGVEVWRVRDGGLGNAYQYMVGGRSWNSARNQAESDELLTVQGHLVDILSQEENAFVQDFFENDPNLCPSVSNPKHCKLLGWIGLSDSETEETFVWTTGESTSQFIRWGTGEPNGSKSNYDHVEIGVDGFWSVVNGASSNNEGYFVEWDVVLPDTPPSF